MAMPIEPASAQSSWPRRARVAQPQALEARGTLTRLTGLVLEAAGLRVPVGAQCQMQMPGQEPVLAEVVEFCRRQGLLDAGGRYPRPVQRQRDASRALCAGAAAGCGWRRAWTPAPACCACLLARACWAAWWIRGQPLDHGGPLAGVTALPMDKPDQRHGTRPGARAAGYTGVRAINALLTVGRGQRLGLLPARAWARKACCWA